MFASIRSLLSGTMAYGVGAAMSKMVIILLLPIFTAYLSPAEYGLVEAGTLLLFLLTTISVLGIDNAVMRFYYDTDVETARADVVKAGAAIIVVAATIVSLLTIFARGFVARLLFGSVAFEPYVLIVAGSLLVSCFHTYQLALFQTRREPGRFAVLNLTRMILVYGLSIAFLISGLQAWGVLLAMFISYAVAAPLGWLLGSGVPLGLPSGNRVRGMIRFGVPAAAGAVGMWMLMSSDRLFLLRLATLEEMGLYSLGARIASVVLLAVTAFQMAWPQEVLSRLQKDGSDLPRRVLTYYLFVGAGIVICVSIFTPELLLLLANPAYERAGSAVMLLSTSYVLYGCSFIFTIVLSIRKNTRPFLWITAPALIANVVLNILLIPVWGFMGSAVASVSGFFIMATLSFIAAQRLSPIRFEWKRIVTIILTAASVLGVNAALVAMHPILLLIAKLVLVCSYPLVLWMLGFFERAELDSLRRLALSIRPGGR